MNLRIVDDLDGDAIAEKIVSSRGESLLQLGQRERADALR